MLIFGGILTPFVLSVTFRGADDIDTTVTKEFATFGAARAGLEDLVVSNQEFIDDFSIDLNRLDVTGGDIVKFDLVTVSDPDRPDREPRTRPVNIVKGVWSISWRKPESPPQSVLDDIARAELQARIRAEIS